MTLEDFIDFCRAKPADEEYTYTSTHNCPIAQFLLSLGYRKVSVSGWGKWEAENALGRMAEAASLANGGPHKGVFLPGNLKWERTFGAIVARYEYYEAHRPDK